MIKASMPRCPRCGSANLDYGDYEALSGAGRWNDETGAHAVDRARAQVKRVNSWIRRCNACGHAWAVED